jgi:hypothetical protein
VRQVVTGDKAEGNKLVANKPNLDWLLACETVPKHQGSHDARNEVKAKGGF